MDYLVIIIARMGSTRLPGKVLKDLCGEPVLTRIIERVKRIACLNQILIATTDQPQDDAIVEYCETNGILYCRGSEPNVLDRVIQASQWGSQIASMHHDYVIEITADCPLICPEILKSMISKCEIQRPDYCSNVMVRSYADGFDIQIVKKEVLYDVYDKVKPWHRCHGVWNVLAYADGIKMINKVPPKQEYWMPECGLTLDTQMDYEVIKRIYEHFANRNYVFNSFDVYELILAHPEILDINKNVIRKIPGKEES